MIETIALQSTLSMFTSDEYLRELNGDEWYCNFTPTELDVWHLCS